VEVAMRWVVKVLNLLLIGVFVFFLIYVFVRVCVCDRFIVKGESMYPQFEDGTAVYVNKLIFGGRIYKDFDFADGSMSSFRLPGLRDIRVGDVVMMNYPYAQCNDSINFRLNYVYMKRCYGVPGDTVRIQNGCYIHPETRKYLEPNVYMRRLSATSDLELSENGVVVDAFQVNKGMGWTIRDFGPLYVPQKGDILEITSENFKTYRKMIHYETGEWPSPEGRYEFKSNWYFFGGDNVLNSRDSRYFGLVPEDYIIGVVCKRRISD
jgi:signal peptidase I